MNTYQVYVTYSVDDTIEVEAESADEALELAQDMVNLDPDLLPYSNKGGYTITWDDASCYDVILTEGEEEE